MDAPGIHNVGPEVRASYWERRDLVGPWKGDGIESTEKRDKEMPAGGNGIIINRKKYSEFFSEALRASAVLSQMLAQMVYPNFIINSSPSHHRCLSISLMLFICGANAEEGKNLGVRKEGVWG